MEIKENFHSTTTFPEFEIKKIDIQAEIKEFPIVPYENRIYVIEEEIEKAGTVWIPQAYAKDGEMQTNIGWVVAIADNVTFCNPGDRVYYGRYSGSWIMDKKYRVMNEEDLLGRFK